VLLTHVFKPSTTSGTQTILRTDTGSESVEQKLMTSSIGYLADKHGVIHRIGPLGVVDVSHNQLPAPALGELRQEIEEHHRVDPSRNRDDIGLPGRHQLVSFESIRESIY
jgi:hypothetical protein